MGHCRGLGSILAQWVKDSGVTAAMVQVVGEALIHFLAQEFPFLCSHKNKTNKAIKKTPQKQIKQKTT